MISVHFFFVENKADGKRRGAASKDSPLVAISSITAGGIIMGFVVAFLAYRLWRNKRNTEEPFFGKFLLSVAAITGYQFFFLVSLLAQLVSSVTRVLHCKAAAAIFVPSLATVHSMFGKALLCY